MNFAATGMSVWPQAPSRVLASPLEDSDGFALVIGKALSTPPPSMPPPVGGMTMPVTDAASPPRIAEGATPSPKGPVPVRSGLAPTPDSPAHPLLSVPIAAASAPAPPAAARATDDEILPDDPSASIAPDAETPPLPDAPSLTPLGAAVLAPGRDPQRDVAPDRAGPVPPRTDGVPRVPTTQDATPSLLATQIVRAGQNAAMSATPAPIPTPLPGTPPTPTPALSTPVPTGSTAPAVEPSPLARPAPPVTAATQHARPFEPLMSAAEAVAVAPVAVPLPSALAAQVVPPIQTAAMPGAPVAPPLDPPMSAPANSATLAAAQAGRAPVIVQDPVATAMPERTGRDRPLSRKTIGSSPAEGSADAAATAPPPIVAAASLAPALLAPVVAMPAAAVARDGRQAKVETLRGVSPAPTVEAGRSAAPISPDVAAATGDAAGSSPSMEVPTFNLAPPTAEAPGDAAPPIALFQIGDRLNAAAPRPPEPAGGHAAAADSPVIPAQPGQLGRQLGVEIARRVSAGGDELVVRLDPAELGRIEVRMSFDERGGLKTVIAADSPAALDILRRDSADLTRSLNDAGFRSTDQSLRFDGGGGDRGGGQPRSPWQRAAADTGQPDNVSAATEFDQTSYRSLRTSGHYDLMA